MIMKEKPRRNFACTLREILGNLVSYMHSNEMENAGFKPCHGYKYFFLWQHPDWLLGLLTNTGLSEPVSLTLHIHRLGQMLLQGNYGLLAAANCRISLWYIHFTLPKQPLHKVCGWSCQTMETQSWSIRHYIIGKKGVSQRTAIDCWVFSSNQCIFHFLSWF
jgi:hypothetical protein